MRWRREPKVCPHLHVPMQSGDDLVLRDMGRHYTAAEYLGQIDALRAAVPHVNVTTDVIVGFPTEDEDAFERTLQAIDDAGITRVHAFSYSPRPGTVAAGARRPRVPPRRRSAARASCAATPRSARATTAPPSSAARERVLIDKVASTQCSGYTADYTRCYLPPAAGDRGQIVDVRLRRAARRRNRL